ncbi:DEAD/DEAH box helicase [Gemmatimonas groenlandica]|uniref:DEAD/DEAH box helicase n=1 Tax=Gemmatimonas groenlandica TaxID=2732249 RepID=A0A6M4IL48_9BACT|nr:DEAD/DEAH box helicase [Gemmatimonas groenlandica]QJR34096.1 DEAD/DEAH box helicase [Gemmatimonas groenlandica]
MTWSLHSARHVQARLAGALIPPLPPAELGDITLLPHQSDAVARIHRAIRVHHGALLADDVGLGKTYTALAVARTYAQVHVIAPAALQPMWRTAITHAQLSHIRLHSVHGFSRKDIAPSAALAGDVPTGVVRERAGQRTLVIIDEAHYLRTRRTARYAAIARFVSGCDTLLLSATPLHNRAAELRNLLALFLGSRADLLSDTMLGQVVIRRSNTNTNTDTNTSTSSGTRTRPPTANETPAASRPPVLQHAPLPMPHDRATLTHILALPAPLPAHDGAVAGALIRLGLLRAWCSSDAALAHALRQRRLRGDALLQALRAGRHPTQVELRSWLVGDHEVQLAFPELMAQQEVESAPLIERVEVHLEALATLAEHHEQTARADGARADALRALLQAHPGTPIIAFSQFTQTVGALHRALSDIAGVGLLSSKHARIASGRISRSEALARFAPLAQERPPPPPHHAIRLLLATDLLAEGVNLQDAGVVVHLDLPWTDALREQRVGRCARIGSPHGAVHVYSFAPHPDGDRALRLQRRLATKAALSRRFAGGDAVNGLRNDWRDGARESAADAASRLHARLQRWTDADAVTESARMTVIGTLRSDQETAWIALVEYQGQSRLLCSFARRATARRRVVSARVRALLRVATIADDARSAAVVSSAGLERAVRRAFRDIRRWCARAAARDDVGPGDQALAPLAQRAARHLAQVVQRCGPIERTALRGAIAAAERVVGTARGSGAEEAMARWCAQAEATPRWAPRAWLTAWEGEPTLANFARDQPGAPERAQESVARVRALLLIGPDYRPDYTSACLDTRSCSTSTAP